MNVAGLGSGELDLDSDMLPHITDAMAYATRRNVCLFRKVHGKAFFLSREPFFWYSRKQRINKTTKKETSKITELFKNFYAVDPSLVRTARFVDRPNRFLVHCDLDGKKVEAFLPNPGRLWEILQPGTLLYLSRDGRVGTRKTEHTVIAAERKGEPVLLHTHLTNDVVEWLLRNTTVPGLEGWAVKKREVVFGRSRFDFLLEKDSQLLFLEVKSCTLFEGALAMFPDAPSLRGKKHVEELGKIGTDGDETAVLFLVQSLCPRFFLPDFHTDPDFAESLYHWRKHLQILPLAVGWGKDLELCGVPRLLPVLWGVYEKRRADEGDYILLCDGGEAGWWAVVGHSENLSSFLRKVKRCHSGFFPFLPEGKVEGIPIRTGEKNTSLGADIAHIAAGEKKVDGKRFFHFATSPKTLGPFVKMLLCHRIDKLLP